MTRTEWKMLCGRTRSIISIFFVACIFIFMLYITAFGKDTAGTWKDSPLKPWFNSLASKKGLCCSFADGFSISDVFWSTDQSGKHYSVLIDGQLIAVPDEAIVEGPNYVQVPMVWPYRDADGELKIRCFLPGGGF